MRPFVHRFRAVPAGPAVAVAAALAAPLARLMIAVLLAVAVAAPAAAQNRSIEDFFGEYVGQSIAGTTTTAGDAGEVRPRHLNVSIQPHNGGFTIAWMTITTRASGKTKAKSYLVNFLPAERENIFASAMRLDAAGQPEPLDPISGDPYVWASIEGDALIVRSLIVTDEGGYEIQVYERRLTEDGMDLLFKSYRDGVQMKEIAGTLKRVSP